MYQFTLEVIQFYGLTLVESIEDIYAHQPVSEILSIKTHYEGLDIARSQKVFYLCFKPDAKIVQEADSDFKKRIKQPATATVLQINRE